MKKSWFCFALLLSGYLYAQEPGIPVSPHLITTGAAELTVQADMATLRFSIAAQDKDSLKVRQAVDVKVAAFVNALSKVGIKPQDLEAGNLQLSPEYQYATDQTPKLSGYRAVRDVSVRLYQLERVNQIIDSALQSGLNAVNDISYGVRDEQRYLTKVRQLAIDDSKAKASELAKAYGMTLGKLYAVSYEDKAAPPVVMAKMGAVPSPSNNPVEASRYIANQLRFTDSIRVVFTLE